MNNSYLMYILVMAGVTYLVRMLPMTLIKGKLRSPFIQSFIYYVPYAVLSAMTIPAIFYSTPDILPSAAGLVTAVLIAFLGKSLLTVALSTCGAVLICELFAMFL